MMYNNGYWGHGFMSSGWSWMIAIGAVLLIVAVIYLSVNRNKNQRSGYNALESLKTKYANGEITEDEYLKRKKIINEK